MEVDKGDMIDLIYNQKAFIEAINSDLEYAKFLAREDGTLVKELQEIAKRYGLDGLVAHA